MSGETPAAWAPGPTAHSGNLPPHRGWGRETPGPHAPPKRTPGTRDWATGRTTVPRPRLEAPAAGLPHVGKRPAVVGRGPRTVTRPPTVGSETAPAHAPGGDGRVGDGTAPGYGLGPPTFQGNGHGRAGAATPTPAPPTLTLGPRTPAMGWLRRTLEPGPGQKEVGPGWTRLLFSGTVGLGTVPRRGTAHDGLPPRVTLTGDPALPWKTVCPAPAPREPRPPPPPNLQTRPCPRSIVTSILRRVRSDPKLNPRCVPTVPHVLRGPQS